MTTSHDSTRTAGIDVSKHKLDLGLSDGAVLPPVTNDPKGHAAVVAFLKRHAIARVGLEATGSYGMAVEAVLREAGFEVIVLQPVQIKLFRTLHRRRAKTDAIDAVLIARFVRDEAARADFYDPRFGPWRERLLYIEQIKSDIACLRARLDRFQAADLRDDIEARIDQLARKAKAMLAALLAEVRAHADLARRLALLVSIPGIGERSALVLLLRLPELGALSRERIAALVGVAPFNADSGTNAGQRRIAGGRKAVRDALYTPTVAAATQWNEDLVAYAERLRAAGKPAKLAFIACMRKLLITANAVLARGTPWTPKTA